MIAREYIVFLNIVYLVFLNKIMFLMFYIVGTL
jgi:hypothetical protein